MSVLTKVCVFAFEKGFVILYLTHMQSGGAVRFKGEPTASVNSSIYKFGDLRSADLSLVNVKYLLCLISFPPFPTLSSFFIVIAEYSQRVPGFHRNKHTCHIYALNNFYY